MTQAIRVIGACLLLSGVLAAGCGGDDDSTAGGNGDAATTGAGEGNSANGDGASGAQSSPRSKKEFTADANELCMQRVQAMKDESAALFTEGEAESPQEAMRAFADKAIVPALEAEAEELRELGAPEGDEEQVEGIVVAIEAMARAAREDPRKFLTRPAEFEEAHDLARKYGIAACGTLPH